MFNKVYDKIKKFIKENYKFLIALIIIFILFTYELPYCIYTPGGKVDLSKRVEVENGYSSKGELSMTYVSMVKPSLPFILLSYTIPNWDLQKENDVSYDDLSLDETLEIDKLYMQEGINNAIISAYKEAKKEVKIKDEKLKVIYVEKDSQSNLKINDEIISVDNVIIKSMDELKNSLLNKNVGDKVEIKINRNNKIKNITATLSLIDGEPKIGIATINLVELETTPKVNVKTKNSESGSSGGLMTALAIYNALVRNDITKGDLIVGTGTIDESGIVGEIDGVKYKLLGAEKKHADIFLCPEENYQEALKIKEKYNLKIQVIKVKTLKDAIKYLESR